MGRTPKQTLSGNYRGTILDGFQGSRAFEMKFSPTGRPLDLTYQLRMQIFRAVSLMEPWELVTNRRLSQPLQDLITDPRYSQYLDVSSPKAGPITPGKC